MNVRAGVAGDLEDALGVWRAALGDDALPEVVDRLRAALDGTDGVAVVAHRGAVVVGVAVAQVEAELVSVEAVVVQPSARRRGVAGALLEGLADAAWPAGARRLSWWVGADDAPALALGRAVGLEESGRERNGAVELVADLDPPLRDLPVRAAGLRLGQLLKLAGVAATGTDAKALLAAGEVAVNGEVDGRRGRQMVDGDVVVAAGTAVRVVLGSD